MSLAELNFGAGGGEPYARALLSSSTEALYLQELHDDLTPSAAPMNFARWNGLADAVDLRLLASVQGPVLDVGCGPGRMVQAAMDLGLDVLGLDVSPTVAELARKGGLPIHEGSIFDAVPGHNSWQTVLLVDGNIGIGGDVAALLARCGELLAPTGEIVVELHPDHTQNRRYVGRLVDLHGNSSDTFPWAEIGLIEMITVASSLGLVLRQSWVAGGRSFCRLA